MLTTPRWYPGYIFGTIFLTLCLVWAPAGLGLLRAQRRVSRGQVAAGLGAVLLLAVVLGRAQEVQYYKHHYTEVDHFLQDGGPKEAYRFARRQHDKRIGIAGSGEIFFGQYGYYGESLDNYVQYIGVPGPNGTYRLATTCRGFVKPDQRRRLRLPDPQPVHDGRGPTGSALPEPGLRLGQERPRREAADRRDRTSSRSPTTSSGSTASSTRRAASRKSARARR